MTATFDGRIGISPEGDLPHTFRRAFESRNSLAEALLNIEIRHVISEMIAMLRMAWSERNLEVIRGLPTLAGLGSVLGS